MAFPKINFKANHLDLDPTLQDILEQKLSALEKYIGDETDVKCEVEFEKITASQSGKIFRVEVNLWLHGKMYRAEATEDSFEMAIDEVRSELDKELRRANNKRDGMMRRGGRKIKEMLRFGRE